MAITPLATALLGVVGAGAFLFLLPLVVDRLVTPSYPAPHPGGGVLVTGASTGIGADAALALAREGFLVFAGVRKPEDGARLVAQQPEIVPVIFDVTRQEHIDQALELVQAELAKRGLPLVRARVRACVRACVCVG
jgi:NADPH:quinone reductase-like Zn-dependent oxidoreductase